jgi:hypothetical protein
MWAKLKAGWASLPHVAQAAIVLFLGTAAGVVEPVIEDWAKGQVVCTVAVGACITGYVLSAVKAGILAVIGLYIPSSLGRKAS